MEECRGEPGSHTAEDDLVASLLSLSSSLSSVPTDFEEAFSDKEEAKRKLSTYHSKSSSDDTVKILNSFIDYLPIDGQQILTKFITTCHDEDALFNLAEHLYSAILVKMKAHGGKTPAVSPPPFRGAASYFEDIAATMLQSPSRAYQMILKQQCLKRDNYQCMLSGLWDSGVRDANVARNVSGSVSLDFAVPTQLAHIIPFSMGKYKDHVEELNVARSWTTLGLLFPDTSKIAGFHPDKINEPMNALTMIQTLHTEFGNFHMALESTNEENEYSICTFPEFPRFFFRELPPLNNAGQRLVKFKKYDDYDLPSKVLLDTHAAIAKILHATGGADAIDKVLEDRENIRCLAGDGSTDIQKLLSVLIHV